MTKILATGNQDELIEELKRQATEASSGAMVGWGSEGPMTTNLQQLTDLGFELKDPGQVPDEELTSRLWELIGGLAQIRVFLMNTDHLSDRELYTKLWRDVIREEVPLLPDDPGAWHVDMLGTGSEDDIHQYLKYFADEDWRRHWLTSWPDYDMPAHENPPCDRDRRLPEPEYGRP
jgi:hypothetical protein